jgi:hypothetical protein
VPTYNAASFTDMREMPWLLPSTVFEKDNGQVLFNFNKGYGSFWVNLLDLRAEIC